MKLKAVEQLLLERDNFDVLQTPYLTEVCEDKVLSVLLMLTDRTEQMDTVLSLSNKIPLFTARC